MHAKWLVRLETRFRGQAWVTALLVFIFLGQAGAVGAKTRERLVFDLKLGFVKGGEAILTIRDTTYNGKKAVDYHLKGRTTGVTDKVFKVDDVYESTVDAETYLPYRSVRNIRERKYRYYNEVFHFQDKDSIYSERTGGKKVPDNLTDILTVFFYFARNNMIEEINKGRTVVLPTLNGHDIQNIKIRFNGYEMVDTPMGPVESMVLSPVVDKGKVLKRSDGMKFYISKEGKIPVQLDFETRAGTLRALLVSYRINGKEQIK
ncbi:MAG TPA: DUF3108 domain-containing protein [Prolixibacteraceae bacterium]|mgnify:FL=1|jgi:hypothetical protein|nr:DUF3108 domain-containing protein [Prolixibacteraceae bacterium]HPJ78219.1 DUF3108 domain-containing protein [Prolixibacteraceae bacterium]HRV90329.1 DUF3108 domain-containing protein [Prolixibacteraceae bacterium]